MKKQTMPSPAFRIFDSHVNIGRGGIEGDPIKSNITAEHILQLMGESNIEQSLIFPASRPGGYAEANEEVARYVTQYPGRFLGFGRIRSEPSVDNVRRSSRGSRLRQSAINRLSSRFWIGPKQNPPEFDEKCQEDLRKCFEEHDLRGIKVHPGEDGYPSRAVLHVLQLYNKPILLHCGRSIDLVRIEEEVIKPFTMPVILAHMGGYPADRKLYLRALDLAKKYPHVYLNTSFVFYQYILELAVKSCPSKVIFGSDSPGVHPLTAVSSILTMRITDELKQMVLRDNVIRIIEN